MVEDAEKKLVNHNTKDFQNGNVSKNETENSEDRTPPDGGTRAWLVMIGSFCCNGILFGVINSYGVFYVEFYENLKKKGAENPSSEAALVGSLAIGTTFLVSAVSGVLTDFIGLRTTTFIGGAIASGGMFLSSFCVDNIAALCVTFGVMFGLGGALSYTPSLAILGHYFKRNLGVVNGIATAGSSVFTVCMPYVLDALIKNIGIVWTLRVLAILAGLIMAIAFLFKPLNQTISTSKKQLKNPFNVTMFKNKKYMIWTLVIGLSMFGYFVPYVYMLKFVKTNFPSSNVDEKLPVLCIGVTSGLGRLLFGYIADLPKVNRILLQQFAFLVIGISTILLPFSTISFVWLIVLSLLMGLFDGCFIALLGPVVFDICGQAYAAQAIGFLLGVCSIPLTVGPYVAGIIYERQNSYTLPLVLAGIPPIIGAVAMFLTRLVRTNPRLKHHPDDPSRNPLKNSNEAHNTSNVSEMKRFDVNGPT